jgi:hypothetical protein
MLAQKGPSTNLIGPQANKKMLIQKRRYFWLMILMQEN